MGPPLSRLGVHGGMGVALTAGRNKPAASMRRTASLAFRSRRRGWMTAIGVPRSVRTTTSPAFTALTAFENC